MDGSGEARRGGAEGPGAASGTGHTQHKVTDLPARLTLPYNQGKKVDGPFFDIYPQSVAASHEEGADGTLAPVLSARRRGLSAAEKARVRTRASQASLPSCTQPSRPLPGSVP